MPQPELLGIVNVTPDSFFDSGSCFDPRDAIAHAYRLVEEGAAAVDVGGESTRPGSREVSLDEELARVLPVLDVLGRELPVPVSIDTRRAAVAQAAAQRGATWLNDTAALRDDPELAAVAAGEGMTVVLMHRQGHPRTMQDDPRYHDVVAEVREFFEERVAAAEAAGISRSRLILDPGLGFGKRPEDSYRLMTCIGELRVHGLRLMVGASRKSFTARYHAVPPERRLPGSLAFAAAARARGVNWLRVHDVGETRAFLATLEALESAEG